MTDKTEQEVKLLENLLEVALAQLKNCDPRVLKTMQDAVDTANRLPRKTGQ